MGKVYEIKLNKSSFFTSNTATKGENKEIVWKEDVGRGMKSLLLSFDAISGLDSR